MKTGNFYYESLADRVRQKVCLDNLSAGDEIATENGLVRETGFSRKTVRRAMDLLVEEGLVERRPGRGVFVRRLHIPSKRIQVVIPDLDMNYHVGMVRGVLAIARERGINIQMYDSHGRTDEDMAFIRSLSKTKDDGAIIIALFHPDFPELIYSLRAEEYPIVVIDRWMWQNVPSILINYLQGGYDLSQELIKRGHTRIAFIGDLEAHIVLERAGGLRDALNDAGHPFDRSMKITVGQEDNPAEWGRKLPKALDDLLSREDPPTAIFCAHDVIAAHTYTYLRKRGLSVPDDISVVGFDDDPICQWLDPPLTSVRRPSEAIGRTAMKMLLQVIKGTADLENRQMPTEVVLRDSIGPPSRRK